MRSCGIRACPAKRPKLAAPPLPLPTDASLKDSPSMPKQLSLVIAGLGLLSLNAAFAQNVYRSVGPDGKVTFSDRPPSIQAPSARVGSTSTQATGASNSSVPLPFELRQIAAKFPVTLYTSSDCAPCASARNLLVGRGIPFNERTVTSNEDYAALQRLSGSTNLPFATIGGQQLLGFAETEWIKYLDVAGYPQQSLLPTGYQRPAPTPLVTLQAITPGKAAAAASNPPEPPPLQRPSPSPAIAPNGGTSPSNPAGIRF